MFKKVVLISTLIILVGSSLVFPPRAHAFFGLADVVIDPALIGQTIAGWLEQAGRFAIDVAFRSLLESLKRRILQTLQDEIVGWIQGDGDPKFVTDFGGTLKDTTNAAIGDTINQLGLAKLCQTIPLPRLQLNLQKQTPFQQQVSCTVDQIVQNLDNFRTNFTAGGWVGYQELLKPQNNRWGTEVLIRDQVSKQTVEKQQAAQQDSQASQGFISITQCLEWRRNYSDGAAHTGEDILSEGGIGSLSDIPWDSKYLSPKIPPPDDTTGRQVGPWHCANNPITTPGTAIAEGLKKSTYSDFDYIVNSQDLTQFLAAIADAAINRLIKAGVEGVSNIQLSQTTDPSRPPPPLYLSTSTRIAGGLYTDLTNATFDQIKNSYLQNLLTASTTLFDSTNALQQASSSDARLIALIGTMPNPANGTLFYCLTQAHRPPLDTTWASSTLTFASTTARQALKSDALQIPLIRTQITTTYNTVNRATSTAALGTINQDIILNVVRTTNDLASAISDIGKQVNDAFTAAQSNLATCNNTP